MDRLKKIICLAKEVYGEVDDLVSEINAKNEKITELKERIDELELHVSSLEDQVEELEAYSEDRYTFEEFKMDLHSRNEFLEHIPDRFTVLDHSLDPDPYSKHNISLRNRVEAMTVKSAMYRSSVGEK